MSVKNKSRETNKQLYDEVKVICYQSWSRIPDPTLVTTVFVTLQNSGPTNQTKSSVQPHTKQGGDGSVEENKQVRGVRRARGRAGCTWADLWPLARWPCKQQRGQQQVRIQWPTEKQKHRHGTQIETTGDHSKEHSRLWEKNCLISTAKIITAGEEHRRTTHRCSSGPDNEAIITPGWMRARQWARKTQN